MADVTVCSSTRWFNSACGTVVLNATTGRHYRMNGTGSTIWMSIIGSCGSEEIADKLSKEFNLPLDSARQDIMNLFKKLQEAGLVQLDREKHGP